jgi:energy-converting hydrogenase Eha subunit G
MLAGLLVRILLLLAGLLAAALLLPGLLVRILVLLARIRVLVRHRRFSFVERSQRQTEEPGIGFSEAQGSVVIIAW